MMLAPAVERDVLQQDDLVIAADLMEGAPKMLRRILFVALAIFLPRPGDPLRGVEQPLAGRIVTRPADQRADRFLDLDRNVDLGRVADQVPVFRARWRGHG